MLVMGRERRAQMLGCPGKDKVSQAVRVAQCPHSGHTAAHGRPVLSYPHLMQCVRGG